MNDNAENSKGIRVRLAEMLRMCGVPVAIRLGSKAITEYREAQVSCCPGYGPDQPLRYMNRPVSEDATLHSQGIGFTFVTPEMLRTAVGQ